MDMPEKHKFYNSNAAGYIACPADQTRLFFFASPGGPPRLAEAVSSPEFFLLALKIHKERMSNGRNVVFLPAGPGDPSYICQFYIAQKAQNF